MTLIFSLLLVLLGTESAVANEKMNLNSNQEKVLKLHKTLHSDSCDNVEDLNTPVESFKIGSKNQFLFLVPCMLGAYQGSTMGYIVSSGGDIQPLMVLSYDDSLQAVVASLDLVGVSFDPTTHILFTFSKGRGLGDCGQSSQSLIQESSFGYISVKTFEIRNKSQCDGNYEAEWTIVFKQ